MAQKEKLKYVEDSIDRDAQIHFENHCGCSAGSLAMTDLLNKEFGDHPLKDYILSNINISTASAFCQGVFYGWKHPEKVDVENLPQEIKDLNYLFAFSFHDNDFGSYFEEGANNFCSELNKLFNNLSDSNKNECEYSINSLTDEINDFISLDNLIKYIARGVYTYSLNNKDINIPIENIFKKCKDIIESFSVEKKESYIFGSIKDVSEKVIKDAAEYQMEPKPNELKDLWLNGEYLFVKIENGFANAWVQ